jgi:hypothetical protein
MRASFGARGEVPAAVSVAGDRLPLRRVLHTWWPLAASWLLMAVELPAVSAVVARLPLPQVSLAAWGGVIFPLSLIIESPIIMLLAASTALSKDYATYRKVRRFMFWAGGLLTALHVLVAFTPLYYFIVRVLIGAPEEIVQPARIGLQLMTPWTMSIAYRRFNQGVLIRFGHSDAVGVGTAVRLVADCLVLGAGLLSGALPGITVAGCAVALGVISEAAYAGLRVRPVVRDELKPAPHSGLNLDLRSFIAFYTPLAMTSLITLLIQPMGSAALSRMPGALESLAAWPVVSGLIFMIRSMGNAYNEVVVAMLDEPRSTLTLRRFTALLVTVSVGLVVVIAATPLSEFWFGAVSALPPSLADLASAAVWFALPVPALTVLQSWFQGTLVNTRHTRPVTEAVAIGLGLSALVLVAGVVFGQWTGLFVTWLAFDVGGVAQTAWLWYRSRGTLRQAMVRDGESVPFTQADLVGG